jgi:hypothetical protein
MRSFFSTQSSARAPVLKYAGAHPGRYRLIVIVRISAVFRGPLNHVVPLSIAGFRVVWVPNWVQIQAISTARASMMQHWADRVDAMSDAKKGGAFPQVGRVTSGETRPLSVNRPLTAPAGTLPYKGQTPLRLSEAASPRSHSANLKPSSFQRGRLFTEPRKTATHRGGPQCWRGWSASARETLGRSPRFAGEK